VAMRRGKFGSSLKRSRRSVASSSSSSSSSSSALLVSETKKRKTSSCSLLPSLRRQTACSFPCHHSQREEASVWSNLLLLHLLCCWAPEHSTTQTRIEHACQAWMVLGAKCVETSASLVIGGVASAQTHRVSWRWLRSPETPMPKTVASRCSQHRHS
jgi:hypothetical protein